MHLTSFPGNTGTNPEKPIYVYFNGYKLRLLEGYAKLKGLKNGTKILSEDEYWEIIRGNAEYGVQKLS